MGGAPEGAIQTKSSDRRKPSAEESVPWRKEKKKKQSCACALILGVVHQLLKQNAFREQADFSKQSSWISPVIK